MAKILVNYKIIFSYPAKLLIVNHLIKKYIVLRFIMRFLMIKYIVMSNNHFIPVICLIQILRHLIRKTILKKFT